MKIEISKPTKDLNDLEFPKLIYCTDTDRIVEVYEHPDKMGKFIAIHRQGDYAGQITTDFKIDQYCVAFNGKIEISN